MFVLVASQDSGSALTEGLGYNVTQPLVFKDFAFERFIENPIHRLLAPRHGQKVVVTPTSINVYGVARSYGRHIDGFKAVEVLYTASSRLIDITIFEERPDVSVPLSLHFEYKPPIHEIAEGRNERIKQFYLKLWYEDNEILPKIDIRDKFTGPENTVEASAVEVFCAIVGNQGESFKTVRNSDAKAPMDFVIVTGWQVSLITPIFLSNV